MSFLSGLVGTPHVGDKGVGNFSLFRLTGVEIPTFSLLVWNTARIAPTLSTVHPEIESGPHLPKRFVIHKLRLAITTNIYK